MSQAAEEARQRYRPERVRVLFVGESPPSRGTFFYHGDSKLYRETERAFRDSIPERIGQDFLTSFAQLGCYLDDLCLLPVDQLKKAGPAGRQQLRQEHAAGVPPLAERMAEADPEAIILIGLGIENFVRRAAVEAGCNRLPFHALPFPNWNRDVVRYRQGLASATCELSQSGILR
jgi:hypothetical protein